MFGVLLFLLCDDVLRLTSELKGPIFLFMTNGAIKFSTEWHLNNMRAAHRATAVAYARQSSVEKGAEKIAWRHGMDGVAALHRFKRKHLLQLALSSRAMARRI